MSNWVLADSFWNICLVLIYRLKRSRPRWRSFIKPLSSRARPLRGSTGVSTEVVNASASLVFKCMSMTSSQTACSASVHVFSKKINVPHQPTHYTVPDQMICERFTTGSPSLPALFRRPLSSLCAHLCYYRNIGNRIAQAKCWISPACAHHLVDLIWSSFFNDSFAYEIWWKQPWCKIGDICRHVFVY